MEELVFCNTSIDMLKHTWTVAMGFILQYVLHDEHLQ
jgi:hypothetical protein